MTMRVPSLNGRHVQIRDIAGIVAQLRQVDAQALADRVIEDDPKGEYAMLLSFDRHIKVMEASAHG